MTFPIALSQGDVSFGGTPLRGFRPTRADPQHVRDVKVESPRVSEARLR